jgi:hypothetical protein
MYGFPDPGQLWENSIGGSSVHVADEAETYQQMSKSFYYYVAS